MIWIQYLAFLWAVVITQTGFGKFGCVPQAGGLITGFSFNVNCACGTVVWVISVRRNLKSLGVLVDKMIEAKKSALEICENSLVTFIEPFCLLL